MNIVRSIREESGLTQAELARAAGTSQPTIAAYESGAKVPSLRTLRRLAGSVGLGLVIDVIPAMTREDRRSLALHRRIAEKLVTDPGAIIEKARANIEKMSGSHGAASELLDEWGAILDQPPALLASTLQDPRPKYRELRQVTPFAGVLDAEERADAYRAFRRDEERR